jgi:hypothetical protein
MNEKEFIIWLHGYLEISGAISLGENELQVIKDHLKEFFVKVTPEKHQAFKDKSKPTPLPDYWPIPVPAQWPSMPAYPYIPPIPPIDPNKIICQQPSVTYCAETPPAPKILC